MNIYLAQVNYTFGKNAFLPFSAGLLWANVCKNDALSNKYNLCEYIFLRENIDNVVSRLETPHIFGFSSYIWNWEYNKALAQKVKQEFPDCLIVFGGPQVPIRSHGFFEQHNYIDVLAHSEGEEVFVDLLQAFNGKVSDLAAVNGLTLNLNGVSQQTGPRERVQSLDDLPSPYLDGVFDDLIQKPYDFHASQETHRGCPYSCTFCDWGSAVFTKLRQFPDSRIKAEIEWFARNKIDLLYNCDANFGIYPRDEEIVNWLVDSKQRTGFPNKFRAAYAKKSGERVFNISERLNAHGMSKGTTISLQSVDKDVLDIIKRTNIHDHQFRDSVVRYNRAGIPTYTEIILGLPGETYQSFKSGIESILQSGQHEGLHIFPCMLLPNSEMSSPEYVAREGIKSCKVPLMLSHSTPSDDPYYEYNDIIVSTNTMSVNDWRSMFRISWAVQTFHCLGLFRTLAVYTHKVHGLGYVDFYEQLTEYFETHQPDSVIASEVSAFEGLLDSVLEGGRWERVVEKCGDITWPAEEASFLNLLMNKDKVFEEVELFLNHLYEKWSGVEPVQEELLCNLVSVQKICLFTADTISETSFEAPGHIVNIVSNQGADSDHCKQTDTVNQYMYIADKTYNGDWESFARDVVWYGRKGLKPSGEIQVAI